MTADPDFHDCEACRYEREEAARRCIYCLPYPIGWACHPCGQWPCVCTTNLLDEGR